MTQQTDFNQIQAESLNLTEHNIEQLKQLFPNVFTEGKIDFDALKSELGEFVETESERYQFTWAGKEHPYRASKQSILTKTRLQKKIQSIEAKIQTYHEQAAQTDR